MEPEFVAKTRYTAQGRDSKLVMARLCQRGLEDADRIIVRLLALRNLQRRLALRSLQRGRNASSEEGLQRVCVALLAAPAGTMDGPVAVRVSLVRNPVLQQGLRHTGSSLKAGAVHRRVAVLLRYGRVCTKFQKSFDDAR